jgi:hypothetical protein
MTADSQPDEKASHSPNRLFRRQNTIIHDIRPQTTASATNPQTFLVQIGAIMKQLLFAGLTFCAAGMVQADGALSIELNAAQTGEGGCTLSFLVANGLEQNIEQAIYETVLFDQNGQVINLSLFDFGALPPGRPRVRQFVLDQTECAAIGRILFNGASTCTAPNLPETACEDRLNLTSRTKIETLG